MHAQIMLQINAIMIYLTLNLYFAYPTFLLSHLNHEHAPAAFLVFSGSSKIFSRQLENVYQNFEFIFAIF